MRRLQGFTLPLRFLLELLREHEVVLDFLQCSEHGLAVSRRGLIGRCGGLHTGESALATIEDRLGQRGAQRPEQIGCTQQVR